MNGKNIAYIRCSSIDQNIERQTEILKKYNIDKSFEEKVSGKDKNRPQLKAMLEYVRERGHCIYSGFFKTCKKCERFTRYSRNIKFKRSKISQCQRKSRYSYTTRKIDVNDVRSYL